MSYTSQFGDLLSNRERFFQRKPPKSDRDVSGNPESQRTYDENFFRNFTRTTKGEATARPGRQNPFQSSPVGPLPNLSAQFKDNDSDGERYSKVPFQHTPAITTSAGREHRVSSDVPSPLRSRVRRFGNATLDYGFDDEYERTSTPRNAQAAMLPSRGGPAWEASANQPRVGSGRLDFGFKGLDDTESAPPRTQEREKIIRRREASDDRPFPSGHGHWEYIDDQDPAKTSHSIYGHRELKYPTLLSEPIIPSAPAEMSKLAPLGRRSQGSGFEALETKRSTRGGLLMDSTPTFFMHYTISEDRSGTPESVSRDILSVLGDNRDAKARTAEAENSGQRLLERGSGRGNDSRRLSDGALDPFQPEILEYYDEHGLKGMRDRINQEFDLVNSEQKYLDVLQKWGALKPEDFKRWKLSQLSSYPEQPERVATNMRQDHLEHQPQPPRDWQRVDEPPDKPSSRRGTDNPIMLTDLDVYEETITQLYLERGLRGMIRQMYHEFEFEASEEDFLLKMDDWRVLDKVDAERAGLIRSRRNEERWARLDGSLGLTP